MFYEVGTLDWLSLELGIGLISVDFGFDWEFGTVASRWMHYLQMEIW